MIDNLLCMLLRCWIEKKCFEMKITLSYYPFLPWSCMNSLLSKDLAKKQKFMAFYGVWNLYCEAIFYDLLFLAVRVMCFKTVFMPNKPPFNSVLRAFTFTRILLIRVSFKCAKRFLSIHQSLFGVKTYHSKLP